MVRRPDLGVLALHDQFGSVVDFGFGRFRYVYLFGPDANKHVSNDHPEHSEWRDAFEFVIPINGDFAIRRIVLRCLFGDTLPGHEHQDILRASASASSPPETALTPTATIALLLITASTRPTGLVVG